MKRRKRMDMVLWLAIGAAFLGGLSLILQKPKK